MLIAKDVPYEWHDGVALIAQLLEQLRSFGSGPQPTTLADLGSIALESTGWLTVASEPARQLPVMPGAAQLLQELLSGIDQPPQLRLYVMQTTGVDPMTPLGQFADELSKWERPNRIAKLGALHTRAVQRIGLAVLTEEANARQKQQTQRLLDRRDKVPGRSRERRSAVTGAAWTRSTLAGALLVIVAGLVAVFEWRYVVEHTRPAPAALTSTVSDEPPRGSAPPVPSGVTERSPEQRRPPARQAPRAESAPASVPVAPVVEAQAQLTRAQELLGQQDFSNARSATEHVLDTLRDNTSTQAQEIKQTARNLDEVARAATVPAPASVAATEYGSDDPGVTPPVPEAFLPPTPDPRTPPEKLQVMEIRINADGDVDSAKFIINRPTYRNAWWPAAAKSWHFKPAMKDGRRVPYVMRIVLDDSDPGR